MYNNHQKTSEDTNQRSGELIREQKVRYYLKA